MSDHPNDPGWKSKRMGALRIAGIYLIIGSLWILFSDRIAAFLATSSEMFTNISILKGWGYVLITAILLYWLIRREFTELHDSSEKLVESENRYRVLVEQAADALVVNDFNGKLVEVNQHTCDNLGYSQAELLQMSLFEIEQDFDLASAQKLWGNIQPGNSGVIYGHQRRKDGTIFPVEVHIGCIEIHGQRLYMGLTRDITERKKAQEEILRLNAELEQRVNERTAELSDLYNHAPCGYHSLDENGLVVRINDTELEWLGYSRAEIENKIRFQDLFTPDSLQIFKKTFPIFKERGWISGLEFDVIRKDGTILSILLSGTAIKDENGKYLLSRSTMMDNNARKHSEEMMQAYQEKLEAANRELEAFAYSVSHDLRAPLRAIDGFSHIILENYSDHLDAEGVRLLNIIRTNTQKMDQLITDLLALSRVSRFEINLTRIDMAAMVNSVYADVADPQTQNQFNFDVSALPDAYGDPTLLRQAWSNLISNAIKYTLPQAEHKIEVGAYQEKDMNVYFIKDSGVGFDPVYAHKLFGVFQRLHNAEQFEGNGVGLAIVQRIIIRHGGKVWAEGNTNEGAIFYFSLPRKDGE